MFCASGAVAMRDCVWREGLTILKAKLRLVRVERPQVTQTEPASSANTPDDEGKYEGKLLYKENKFPLVLQHAYKNRTGTHENPEANLIRQLKETRDTRRCRMNGCHDHDTDYVSLPPEHKSVNVIPGMGISKS
ncbi:hypothetical protein PTTG_26500 [Puccinia triticina 1-1 BBBD Race 1]|uniref:Uncharacterized protein n=2 Tax=Puccinia triticina TaxID=208348 RepID=A0A180GTQ2_PUCT1|nr:uncharacterized protein PtA15_4A648 [Puccinia triticina]OAV95904.1 hypothetical protein PTTG_26500 [Puccinia triticina 1-1 BBBD Race 1]WAQ84196.1 hypothetical protein PtA15_4A648 [Puccinia triticina]